MIHLAIFASGNGSNAENIIQYFQKKHPETLFSIYTHRSDAFVVKRAATLNIPVRIFSKEEWKQEKILSELLINKVSHIVLAGFLWLVPDSIVSKYSNKIINIHPSLLPKYGGKGMYGHHVHEAIILAHEDISGITIHLVNEHYDKGEILFQAHCAVDKEDTAETLAMKIHHLEYQYYPEIIEKWIMGVH